MRIRLVVASLATVLGSLAVPAAAHASVDPGPSQIIGGNTVSIAPWAAAVFGNGSFTCSGTIISATYVLTATHCISGAQVGVASLADGQSRQIYGSVAYNRSWITSVAGV